MNILRKCFKKHILVCLFIIVNSQVVIGQQNVADSFQNLINTGTTKQEKLATWLKYAAYSATNNVHDINAIITPALDLAKNLKDSATLAVLLKLKGLACNTVGKRDSALFYYYQAVAILETQKPNKDLAYLYNDIARLNRKTDQQRAIGFYDKALKIFNDLNDIEGRAVILNESGVAFELSGQLEEAESRYNQSLVLQTQRNDSLGISYSLGMLAGLHMLKGNTAVSEKFAKESLAIREQLKDSFALAIAVTNMGEFYIQTNQTNEAIPYFERSNTIASAIGYLDIQSYNYGQLAAAYEKLGNYKLALENQHAGNVLKDSIYSKEKTKQIEALSVQYETAQKEKQIQEQAFEIERKNNLIGFALLILLLVASVLIWMYKRKKYRENQAYQAFQLKQQEEATLAIMQAEENERRRIAAELHDGVGQMMSAAKMNLSALESELESLPIQVKNRYEKIINLVDDSCKEVRSVSHQMMPNALLKRGLGNAIRDFIDKIDAKVLQVSFYAQGLDNKLPEQTETALYRIIQECINNVLKHSGANTLDISIHNEADGMDIIIEDNGCGFNKDAANYNEGLGLKNIRSRTLLLGGKVEISSKINEGTLVAIFVPN